jgi:divalent metal cation (Fe/Co/Zn/Cd) transporter
VFAAIKSLSLSLLATAIDSVFDPLGNLLLWYLHRKSKRLDVNMWPVGGERLTTIGNICYGSLYVHIEIASIALAS